MLPAKPWKAEAVVRLLVCVVICHFLGAVAMGVVRFAGGEGTVDRKIFTALVAAGVVFLGAALYVLRKPWPVERFMRRFLFLLICLYFGLVFGMLAQRYAGNVAADNPTWRTAIATLSFQGAIIALSWPLLSEHQMRYRDAFGFAVKRQRAVLYGVLLACVFLPIALELQWVSFEVLWRVGAEPEPQQVVQVLQHSVTWRDQAIIGLTALVLAPIGEEFFFRGILYTAIKQAGFPRVALWGTSIFFAAVHFNLPTFISLLLLAVLLTILYEKTGNLLACISAHCCFNAVGFIETVFGTQLSEMLDKLRHLLAV